MFESVRENSRIERVGIAVAALVSSFLGLETAMGQNSGDITVEVGECVELTSPDERLACFEARVQAELEERGAAPARAEERAQSDPATAPTSRVEESDRDLATENRAATEDRTATENASADRDERTRDRRRREPPQEFHGTVAGLRETVPNAFVITLDNGQVWHQVRPKWYPLIPGQEVRIYATNWGSSFRLTTAERSGYIQVERVR